MAQRANISRTTLVKVEKGDPGVGVGMIRNNEGLTKTYNRFHDPNETSPDIQRLRELHAAMDRVQEELWQGVQVKLSGPRAAPPHGRRPVRGDPGWRTATG